MRLLRSAVVVVALGVFSTSVSAAPIVIDFESLGDLDTLSQLSVGGISFTGGIALVSGVNGGSLNDSDFPRQETSSRSTPTRPGSESTLREGRPASAATLPTIRKSR